MLDTMSVRDIVIDGIKPAADVSETEHHGYRELCKQALLVLIQSLSKPIVKKIANLRSPHQIWTFLKQTYYMDPALSFVHQVAALCLLPLQLEKGMAVMEFMDKYDEQWDRVHQMTGPNQYRQVFRQFLEEALQKRLPDLCPQPAAPHARTL